MHWLQKTYVAIPVLIDSFLQIELKSPCNDSEQEVAISVKVWKQDWHGQHPKRSLSDSQLFPFVAVAEAVEVFSFEGMKPFYLQPHAQTIFKRFLGLGVRSRLTQLISFGQMKTVGRSR